MSPIHSSQDAGREPSVRVVRRQLITAHGAKEMPTPRVVLHLPDLDALQTVALGPVRPSGSRRRIDAAHDVEPTAKRSSSRKLDTKKSADDDKSPDAAAPLLNLLRIPLKKWLTTEGAGKLTAGSLVVLMQQPKVMLGAIVALGMQLAAILAMLGGGGSSSEKSTTPVTPAAGNVAQTQPNIPHGPVPHSAQHSVDNDHHAAHDHRPIQTPLNALTADGKPFAGPALLPAPQALAGVDPKDVPPWQAPVTNLPTPTAGPARSEKVAVPTPASTAAPATAGPTFGAPPSLGTGNIAISPPEASSPAVTNTTNPSTTGPTNVVQTSGARAKLKGTIQRKPSGAN